MPTWTTIAAFTAVTLGLIALPGPSNLYILARGLQHGRRAAAASALGIETGTVVYVLTTAAGLSALLVSSATAFTLVRYLGAAYLLWLGVQALRRRPSPQPSHAPAAGGLWRAYRQGLVVGLANPKVALFFVSFLPQFVDPARGSASAQILVLGAIFVALGVAADLANALASGTLGRLLARRPSVLRRQHYAEGVLYLSLGAWAALADPRPARR